MQFFFFFGISYDLICIFDIDANIIYIFSKTKRLYVCKFFYKKMSELKFRKLFNNNLQNLYQKKKH